MISNAAAQRWSLAETANYRARPYILAHRARSIRGLSACARDQARHHQACAAEGLRPELEADRNRSALCCRWPRPRQFVELAREMAVDDFGEDIGQVSLRIDGVKFAGLDQTRKSAPRARTTFFTDDWLMTLQGPGRKRPRVSNPKSRQAASPHADFREGVINPSL